MDDRHRDFNDREIGIEITGGMHILSRKKPVKKLSASMADLIKGSNEEKLRLTAKILRAIYL